MEMEQFINSTIISRHFVLEISFQSILFDEKKMKFWLQTDERR